MRRRSQFTTTVRHGRRAGAPTLVVHLDRDDAAPPQVGFVVPRAVGGAVVRNGVRRRLRALCRERLSTLPAGARVVVRVLPPAAGASSAALARDLDAALARVTSPARSR
jgi:ribonuclease P protein component